MEDEGGTLYKVQLDPGVYDYHADPKDPGPKIPVCIPDAVRNNGAVLSGPDRTVFKLYDDSDPPTDDIETDRPYAGLTLETETGNLFVGCFSGIDIPRISVPGRELADSSPSFRKNATDGIHRYHIDSGNWYPVERFDAAQIQDADDRAQFQRERKEVPQPSDYAPISMDSGQFPFKRNGPPPWGWLNGTNGVHVYGGGLYAVAKDNHILVRYDLGDIFQDSSAGPPVGREVHRGPYLATDPGGFFHGPSAAVVNPVHWVDPNTQKSHHHIYVSFRSNNTIYRHLLDDDGTLLGGQSWEKVAEFRAKAELIDLAFNSSGDLYVSAKSGGRLQSAKTGAIWKFSPDSIGLPWDATDELPFATMPAACSNLAVDDLDVVYVCCNQKVCEENYAGVIYELEEWI